MECVIDCSLALAWVLPDEESGRAERFLERLPPEAVLRVPGLWWYELSNALTMAQRRKRLADVDRRRALDLFKNLPIETDLNIGAELSGRLQDSPTAIRCLPTTPPTSTWPSGSTWGWAP